MKFAPGLSSEEIYISKNPSVQEINVSLSDAPDTALEYEERPARISRQNVAENATVSEPVDTRTEDQKARYREGTITVDVRSPVKVTHRFTINKWEVLDSYDYHARDNVGEKGRRIIVLSFKKVKKPSK